MIGKHDENLPIADYNNIEIKVKKRYSKGKITLFAANLDNEVFAIRRIYETYGACNINKKYFKTFVIKVTTTEYSSKGNYFFRLKVDYDKKIVKMQIYDIYYNLVEEKISWSFDLIWEKIFYKIKNLAIVKVDTKKMKI